VILEFEQEIGCTIKLVMPKSVLDDLWPLTLTLTCRKWLIICQ